MASAAKKIDIGFAVGQSLQLRVSDEEYARLRKALVDGKGDTWYEVKAEDCEVAISMPQVVYLRLDVERDRIGF